MNSTKPAENIPSVKHIPLEFYSRKNGLDFLLYVPEDLSPEERPAYILSGASNLTTVVFAERTDSSDEFFADAGAALIRQTATACMLYYPLIENRQARVEDICHFLDYPQDASNMYDTLLHMAENTEYEYILDTLGSAEKENFGDGMDPTLRQSCATSARYTISCLLKI